MKGAKVRLSNDGLFHYPRRHKSRANKVGEVIGVLPSGMYAIEWPWGIAFNTPREVSFA